MKAENKIKIAYILPTLDQGGAERFTVDLLRNLDREIYDPLLILFKRGGKWTADLAEKNLPYVILEKRRKIDPANFWRLYSELRRFRPQIVHTQLGGDIYGRLAARLLGVPVILSTEQNVNPDEKISVNVLKKMTSRFADTIVAISEAVKYDSIRRYGTALGKITLIPNGLDLSRFKIGRDETKRQRAQTLTFGTLGRLVPQKGQSLIIEAWPKLKHPGLRCLMAGSGPLAGELEAAIAKNGLKEKIKLVGPIDDTAGYLKTLDAFILPSLWEGQGIVLLEAGLAGLPIIASAVDGVVELLGTDSGSLFAAGNASSLAAAIDRLADNFESEETADRAARLAAKIAENYDIRKIVRSYEKLYQELLRRKGL